MSQVSRMIEGPVDIVADKDAIVFARQVLCFAEELVPHFVAGEVVYAQVYFGKAVVCQEKGTGRDDKQSQRLERPPVLALAVIL